MELLSTMVFSPALKSVIRSLGDQDAHGSSPGDNMSINRWRGAGLELVSSRTVSCPLLPVAGNGSGPSQGILENQKQAFVLLYGYFYLNGPCTAIVLKKSFPNFQHDFGIMPTSRSALYSEIVDRVMGRGRRRIDQYGWLGAFSTQ
jgi:hypothetical protein